jgi:predicted metal-binding membrane protein
MDAVSTHGGSGTAHAHETMDAGSAHGDMDGMSMPGLAGRPAAETGGPLSLVNLQRGWSELPFWILMCVATMIPVAVPAVRHVAANSLRRRRQRAIAGFLLAYLGLWVAFGAVTLPVLEALDQAAPRWPTILAGAAIVVVWQLLPLQAGLHRRCHQTVALPPLGWRAHLGCLRFGSHHGLACLAVCGPLMVLMALLLHAGLVWMVVLSAVIVVIRLYPGSAPLVAADRAMSRLYYRLRWS